MKPTTFIPGSRRAALALAGLATALMATGATAAKTPLADQPIAIADVPANVLLALSVEFPTAITRAHRRDKDEFKPELRKYLGYFDPKKCYTYADGYFQPVGFTDGNYACNNDRRENNWSGNFMNWATMQGIDTFRWVLTGGLRITDTPKQFAGASGSPLGKTILQRAFASKQPDNDEGYLKKNFPDRSLRGDLVKSYTGLPEKFHGKTLWIRNGGMGVQVRFGYQASEDSINSRPWQIGARPPSDYPIAEQIETLNVNVEVCRDEGSGANSYLESNCRKYVDATGTKTVWKPVGLMQQYRDKMYFGAFGYLHLPQETSANRARDGGVLRAQVQSIDNEITETGAFLDDPYKMKASQSVNNSGTINYLNKFGQNSGKYKYFDPVSEMYAEAVKYFKAMKPTASYVADVDATLRDGFPVFTEWNDPAKDAKYPTQGALSCKKNFILGIGDTTTNYDRNLSGGDSPVPSDVDSDMAGKTAKAWTDLVGSLEGKGTSLGSDKLEGSNQGSYMIAGIAYYAHSNDIRADVKGAQTVSTYWMDVLEDGYRDKNQYWLAAKYGGYKMPDPNTPSAFNASTSIWGGDDVKKTNIRKSDTGDDLPNSYYDVSWPDKMLAGLQSAFTSISSGAGAAAGTALSSLQLSETEGDSTTYQGSYDAGTWSGDVVASKITKIVDDQPKLEPQWSAAAKLATIGSDNRVIVTLAPTDKSKDSPTPAELKGTPFRWDNLSATQKFNLGSGDDTDGRNILNYLRGDRTNESTATVTKNYRLRTGLLGDIVDSRVVYLGKPNASYSDTYNPGYTTFKDDKAGRTPLIFVGANDGMLHAFDASEGSNAGNEVFAVVPYSSYEGPDQTPQISGLQALARPTYTHRYYMNATPEIRDVDFARTGNSLSSFSASTPADWRTLLVTGQGKGGRSFIAVDVTNITPGSLTESAMAGKVLWEFAHPNMGYSFGRPLIAKTRRWGWVVILSSGYNNSLTGKGAIFVLNAKTGELLKGPIETSAGTEATPAGLAQIEGYTESYADYTLSYVYGGDLLGNLWRFDFTDGTKDPVALKIAELKTPDGAAQPVTTAPKIEYSAKDLKRYVFVGTGRLLSPEDQGNSQQHTMYAFRDGTKSRAYGKESYEVPLPENISFPITRQKMARVANLLAGASADDAYPMGWYYDLTSSWDEEGAAGEKERQTATERIVLNLQANDGVLTWIGSLPNDDPCSPSGASRLYSTYYGSGQSVLTVIEGDKRVRRQWIGDPKALGLADTALVRIGSRISVLGTDVSGGSKIYGSTLAEAGEPRVTNWRIIHE